MRIRSMAVVAVAALALAGVGAATAAAPGTPDVTKMALRTTDVPGAKLAHEGSVREPGYVSAYMRQLSFAKPFGSSKIVFVFSEAALAASPERATQDLSDARRALGSTAGRNEVVSGIVKSAGNGVTRKDVGLGRLRTPQVGDGAVELPLSIRFKGSRVSESILLLRVDRVLHTLVVGALPGHAVAPADTARLAAILASHSAEGLVPIAIAAPAVTGAVQIGQTLTASTGSWGVDPTTYGFQWQRCDAAGASCADIAGATAAAYAVLPEDAGFTLRVSVAAQNRFGTATQVSATTAAAA